LTVLSNLFLVQNITHSGSVNCVLWSLPFEVQMYTVLPVLFIILRRYPSIGAAWGAWAAGVVLATAEYLIRGGGPAEGDLLLRYFPCFIAGILAWWLLERRQGTLSGGYWILTLVLLVFAYRLADAIRVYGPALALALHGTLRNDHQIWWPPSMELVNDWGFCCLTGLAIPLFADIRSKWLNATTKSIARYSYGIYVCHVPILWLIFVKLHIASLEIGALLSLILTLLMSVALYNFLEDPAIRLGKRLASQLAYSGITA
jgi:peptidoglycan/LPS O-acetylase OafA/YrhL